MSIGLPVFNAGRYLQSTLDSILAQTFEDFELVICDNASTDDTEAICRAAASRDSRIRYHRNPTNLGSHPNHQRVLDLSTGEYFKWAGYDDLLAPAFLEECVRTLDDRDDVVLCFSQFEVIDESGQVVGHSPPPPPRVDSPNPHERLRQFWDSPRVHQVIYGLTRRDALMRVGPLGSWYGAERATLFELALIGGFERIDLPLFSHREHQQRSAYVDRRLYWSPALGKDDTDFGFWRRIGQLYGIWSRHPFSASEKLAVLREFVWYGVLRTPYWLPRLVGELIGGLRRAVRPAPASKAPSGHSIDPSRPA